MVDFHWIWKIELLKMIYEISIYKIVNKIDLTSICKCYNCPINRIIYFWNFIKLKRSERWNINYNIDLIFLWLFDWPNL